MAARRPRPGNPRETDETTPASEAPEGDEVGAAELGRRVSEALRKFRHDRRLSLDDLALRSGVSRAALWQVENGRTNPTLAVLWKIAVGLEVPFHELLGLSEDTGPRVLRAGESPALRGGDGRMVSRLMSPGGSDPDVELYELRFAPRAVHASDPHSRGTSETVVLLTGSLRVNVKGVSFDLAPGDSIFFRADAPHSYENMGSREARCLDVIHYKRE